MTSWLHIWDVVNAVQQKIAKIARVGIIRRLEDKDAALSAAIRSLQDID
jgi:hypothetical protein